MAERTSSRAGSRRTTPQPAPQTARAGTQGLPKRIARTTRSQSRDVGDGEEKRTGLETRKVKQATPDATNDAIGHNGPNRRNGSVENNAQIQQDLSVVVEDPSVVYPELEMAGYGGASESVEDARAGQQPTQQNHKSPGGLSAFSGTTAGTSLSTQDLTESSKEEIIDTLPDLSEASDKVLSFAIPAELSETSVATAVAQLQNNDTREHKKLKRLGDTFEVQRKDYGIKTYIHVGDTLRKLLGRKVAPISEQTASWRPDALFQKANLANLVLKIVSIAEQDEKDHFLEDIASIFPHPFAQRLGLAQSLTPECTALAEATFQLALEIRTQEAIMLFARHVRKINFDPDTVLLQLFYDGNELKGWTVLGLRAEDLGKEAKDTILKRVERLRGAFQQNGQAPSNGQFSGVDSLRVDFPWTTFTQKIVAWAGQRLVEIEIQTTTHGSAQAICQGLSNVVQSGKHGQSIKTVSAHDESDDAELRLDYDMPSGSRATSEQQDASAKSAKATKLQLAPFSGSSEKSKASATILKRRQIDRKVSTAPAQVSLAQNRESDSIVQVESTAGPSVPALTPQRIPNDQIVPSPAPSYVPSRQGLLLEQHDDWHPEDDEEEEPDIRIRRNAQASLAYRTEREAESNKENVGEVPESQRPRTTKKRNIYERDPLGLVITEVSSDEGFQDQAGPSNVARQRRLKPATKRPASEPVRPERRSPKKVRVQGNTNEHRVDDRAGVARHDEDKEPPLSQAHDEYVRVNQSAKRKTAAVTKPPQSRSAWTGVETDVLYHLIVTHGTSWTRLKDEDEAQGHVLQARGQVALKDKARNMKMDYLKAGTVLPNNFERVALSQLQIDKLRNGGIDYDPETGTRVDAEVSD